MLEVDIFLYGHYSKANIPFSCEWLYVISMSFVGRV